MAKDSLGDRIKLYEGAFRHNLPIRMPVILRLDGKAFHSYTRKCKRPFDETLFSCMDETAIYLCNEIQGAEVAYIQSDEINILINNYKKLETKSWFDNNIQKMVSISASMAAAYFNSISDRLFVGSNKKPLAAFDCRAFVVSKEEVNNVFVWRQLDATRNSIQMLARSMFSHSQCNNKSCSQLQEMCFKNGFNWNDLPVNQKRGRCVIKNKVLKNVVDVKTGEAKTIERSVWGLDNEIPIFSKDKNYIEKLI